MTTSEQWRVIRGYPEYEVSSRGRVRSKKWRSPVRILKQSKVQGYPVVSLSHEGQIVQRRVHRLVLEAFVGDAQPGQVGRHLDGKRDNNRLANLAWGTVAENNADTVKHGTHRNARKTHCKNGHSLSGDNLVVNNRKERGCRTCINEGKRRRR